MKKGLIIMLCGLPGSGKTTLAKELEIKRKAIRLCPDEWIVAILENDFKMSVADKIRAPLEKYLLKQAIKIANLGNDVILENGFWTISDRTYYREFIEKAGLEVYLYYLYSPLNILKKRVNERNQEKYMFKVQAYNLDHWNKIFEEPKEDEEKLYKYFEKINSF